MSEDELMELKELRAYRQLHEGKALNRAFARLEQLLALPAYDPAMSNKGFRAIAECLICLREEIGSRGDGKR